MAGVHLPGPHPIQVWADFPKGKALELRGGVCGRGSGNPLVRRRDRRVAAEGPAGALQWEGACTGGTKRGRAGARSTQIRAQWLQGAGTKKCAGQPHRASQAEVSDRLAVCPENRG